ncbi:MAG: Bax inhibitor-1/YccA family protein [Bacteroidia bacterium]|nr:Bax inhibitor-1/YccA family protein [Bacteroidia bacterium]
MLNTQTSIQTESGVTAASFITGVYSWMTLALLVTGITAFVTAATPSVIETIFSSRIIFWSILIAELGLVWYISSRILTLSNGIATLLFLLYSCLNGLTLSVILLIYTSSSVALTFFVTAGTFGVMSVAGYFTKKDLSNFGSLMIMGLIGIIFASLANFFMKSETLSYIITYIGVMVFVGLTAYDTQKIKNMANELESDQVHKASILGALTLYLDFINLFLFLLRLLGGRK